MTTKLLFAVFGEHIMYFLTQLWIIPFSGGNSSKHTQQDSNNHDERENDHPG